jgi:hypothetical protein
MQCETKASKIPLNCIPSPEIPREKMEKSPLEKCDIRNCPYFIAIPPGKYLTIVYPGNSKEAMKKAPWKSDILLGSPGISKHFNSLEFPVFHCYTPWKISYNCIPSLEFPRGNSPLRKGEKCFGCFEISNINFIIYIVSLAFPGFHCLKQIVI